MQLDRYSEALENRAPFAAILDIKIGRNPAANAPLRPKETRCQPQIGYSVRSSASRSI